MKVLVLIILALLLSALNFAAISRSCLSFHLQDFHANLVSLLPVHSYLLQPLPIHRSAPRQLTRSIHPSRNALQWSEWVTGIVLEMLSHRTPPESIPANILAVGRLISPNYDIVESVPRIIFAQNCRSGSVFGG